MYFFKLLGKLLVLVTCLFIAFSVVILSFDFCINFINWVKESVIPFFKDLKNTIYDIAQLEWGTLYKEVKKELRKWWREYKIEIIFISSGVVIIIVLTAILYHHAIHLVSLIK